MIEVRIKINTEYFAIFDKEKKKRIGSSYFESRQVIKDYVFWKTNNATRIQKMLINRFLGSEYVRFDILHELLIFPLCLLSSQKKAKILTCHKMKHDINRCILEIWLDKLFNVSSTWKHEFSHSDSLLLFNKVYYFSGENIIIDCHSIVSTWKYLTHSTNKIWCNFLSKRIHPQRK